MPRSGFACRRGLVYVTDPVTIVLLGEPVPWARAAGGRSRKLFTPTKQRNNAATLHMAAVHAMQEREKISPSTGYPIPYEPIAVPVRLDLLAEITVPSSWSGRMKARAICGELLPGKKPDLSNIVKQVEDALKGVVYTDDKLIVELNARKIYGVQPK